VLKKPSSSKLNGNGWQTFDLKPHTGADGRLSLRSRHIARRFLPAFALLLLESCGTILDPAPYSPDTDHVLLAASSPPYTQQSVLTFSDLNDATKKLLVLSNGYRMAAQDISRQQLAFDVPLFGLAIATVGNGAFQGSKDATVALGLSAATVQAGKSYLSPATKIIAYSNAGYSLFCGSQVSALIGHIYERKGGDITHVSDLLEKLLPEASATLIDGKFGEPPASGKDTRTALSKDQSANLLDLRDKALKAYQDIMAATDTILDAPIQLQWFAMQIVGGTTKTVYTSTQNIDAATALIQKASSQSTTTPTAITPGPLHAAGEPVAADFGDLTAQLQLTTTEAEQLANSVSTSWGTLVTCALPKS